MSDDTARLNSRLAEAHRYYRAIEPALAMTMEQRAVLAEKRRLEFAVAAYYLLETSNEINGMLTDVVLGTAVQNAATEPLREYRQILAPRSGEVVSLLYKLLNLSEDAEPDDENKALLDPVQRILEIGLDFCEVSDTGLYSEAELDKVRHLLRSEFFRPDEWLRNATELQPVVGTDMDRRLPSAVRVRLRELYHSFVLGNYLAALSLARSTLEYCLLHRAGALGIQVYPEDSRTERPRRLSFLVEDAGEKRPEIVGSMRDIVESGNRVLHPRKKETITLHPVILRQDALRAVHELREVIETIYLK